MAEPRGLGKDCGHWGQGKVGAFPGEAAPPLGLPGTWDQVPAPRFVLLSSCCWLLGLTLLQSQLLHICHLGAHVAPGGLAVQPPFLLLAHAEPWVPLLYFP